MKQFEVTYVTPSYVTAVELYRPFYANYFYANYFYANYFYANRGISVGTVTS
jgi:hypothetical protein